MEHVDLKGYVTCAWGVSNVGYVLICYGLADALCSFSFGAIMKIIKKRWPVFIFGALLNAGLITVLFLWEPNKDEKVRKWCSCLVALKITCALRAWLCFDLSAQRFWSEHFSVKTKQNKKFNFF